MVVGTWISVDVRSITLDGSSGVIVSVPRVSVPVASTWYHDDLLQSWKTWDHSVPKERKENKDKTLKSLRVPNPNPIFVVNELPLTGESISSPFSERPLSSLVSWNLSWDPNPWEIRLLGLFLRKLVLTMCPFDTLKPKTYSWVKSRVKISCPWHYTTRGSRSQRKYRSLGISLNYEIIISDKSRTF